MVIDQSTLSPVPWLEKTGRVICDTMWYDGQCAAWRRHVNLLKKMLNPSPRRMATPSRWATSMSSTWSTSRNARSRCSVGSRFSSPRAPISTRRSTNLIRVLDAQGIDIITYNVEHGPGQIEINYSAPSTASRQPTAPSCSRTRSRNILVKHGLLATFMTKPYKGLSGSPARTSTSRLLDSQDGPERCSSIKPTWSMACRRLMQAASSRAFSTTPAPRWRCGARRRTATAAFARTPMRPPTFRGASRIAAASDPRQSELRPGDPPRSAGAGRDFPIPI